MTDAPKSTTLLGRVKTRLQIVSVAKALYAASVAVLAVAVAVVLLIRLLGLIPQSQEQPLWLLSIPAIAVLLAGIFHRRVEQQTAARVVDDHAKTKDLFLTLSSLSSSAGEYQPLVTSSAEQRAEQIIPDDVVPFRFGERVARVVAVAAAFALAVLLTPQLDPFGKVEAATKTENQKKEIEAIHKDALSRADRLKKEAKRADEESGEIEARVNEMKSDFRKMQPKKVDSNTKVLDSHRMDLGDMWKSVSNDQLRRMMNQPISKQQLGGTRSQKMNEWLKDLQEGKTESLQQELKKAQQTMQAMMEAKDPEERKKLASQLQRELQDLQKFAKDKAGSKELAAALSKAMKSLQAAKNPGENPQQLELSKDAMEALKQSLELSEKEMEQVAQAAKDLKKLEDAMKTLQQAQQLNQKGQLDGAKCEGCESLADYADMYAAMMGEGAGEGDKDVNDGGRGVGRGGESAEDDSDPEGYKKEKEKLQVQAGKILLSIKTKEYAEELDFDPEKMRQYQKSISSLKSSVQSAIDSEEIPPGYVDGIKGYFDKIENVDPKLKAE
jgi:tetratricopeptide (TPR) repeat protein